MAVYKRAGLDPLLTPRNAGSYPGYVFTGAPLKLAAAHFGLGHGGGAHAPDEYFVIESTNPQVRGLGRRGALVRRLPVRAGGREVGQTPPSARGASTRARRRPTSSTTVRTPSGISAASARGSSPEKSAHTTPTFSITADSRAPAGSAKPPHARSSR